MMTNRFVSILLIPFLLAAMVPFTSADEPALEKAEAAATFKVLSYNIHHGRGSDGKVDLERIAGIIKASGADLVALQEVDRLTGRTGGVDQAAELAKLTGMQAVFGRAIDFSGGQYGDAILSRFPIKEKQVIPLPTAANKEDRVAVMVEVEVKGTPIAFVATHLSHERGSEGERLKAFAKVLEMLTKSRGGANAILAGDFNAGPKSKEIEALRKDWILAGDKQDLPTYPADKPRIRIDYICLRKGAELKVKPLQVMVEKVASDHCPILATFVLPEGE